MKKKTYTVCKTNGEHFEVTKEWFDGILSTKDLDNAEEIILIRNLLSGAEELKIKYFYKGEYRIICWENVGGTWSFPEECKY